MAAALATAVKGREVVDDAVALKTVAAEQLDIDRFAFNSIVTILEEADFIRNVRRSGGSITSFYESVPETFERLYATLGEVWSERTPGELERALLDTVQELSLGPRRVVELEIDPSGLDRVLHLGSEADQTGEGLLPSTGGFLEADTLRRWTALTLQTPDAISRATTGSCRAGAI